MDTTRVKPAIIVAACVIVAGAGAAYFLHGRRAQPAMPPASTAAAPAAPADETAVQNPIPSPAPDSAAKGPLPTLGDSDPALRDALSGIFGGEAIAQYLVPDDIIRHLVVTIDNLPRQKAPMNKRPMVPVGGTFLAVGDELHATIDPGNFARYDPMIAIVNKVDMQKLAQVYLRFYPLFQSVYQDLGYPNGYFNDRLVQTIDSLLAAPQPVGPLQLTRPNVLYTFADPTLEALPAGQKMMLRMGPANATALKAKLAELRAIIAKAPPKH
jgi:hypothetical protein